MFKELIITKRLCCLSVLLLGGFLPRLEIWRGAGVLDKDRPLVIVPTRPLLLRGPTTEVCLGLSEPGAMADGDSIILPNRASVSLQVLLVGPGDEVDSLYRDFHNWRITETNGRRDSVPRGPEPPSLSEFGDGNVCIWTQDQENWRAHNFRTVRRVVLRASHELHLWKVLWWSGKRTGSF